VCVCLCVFRELIELNLTLLKAKRIPRVYFTLARVTSVRVGTAHTTVYSRVDGILSIYIITHVYRGAFYIIVL